MTGRDESDSATAAVTVELFGAARIRAGVRAVSLQVNAGATATVLARALAHECPALLGNAVSVDGSIAEGYTLNRNGLAFLAPDSDAPLHLQSGDTLLLLSNQAGG